MSENNTKLKADYFKAVLLYLLYASSFMGFRAIATEGGIYVPTFKAIEVNMIDPYESLKPAAKEKR